MSLWARFLHYSCLSSYPDFSKWWIVTWYKANIFEKKKVAFDQSVYYGNRLEQEY